MRKGCAFIIVALVALVVAMFVTCPSEAEHKAVLNREFSAAINEKFGIDKSDDIIGSIFNMIGQSAVGLSSGFAINNIVTVDNYYIVSIGKMNYGGKERIVSVGVLNHVFAPDKDFILKMMKENGI
jgi:hypothetical protein